MSVVLAFMFLTNFLLHLCYEFECPNSSQWQLRSTAICNSSELYGCLCDKIQNTYTERCINSPSVERIGRKNVFSGGIDRVPCEHNRFQPFTFSTNGNDECVYAKSICSLEGQVVSDDGESDIDASCTCDYTYGYAFVHEPAAKCKCDPFIEDCTCYKKLCPPNSVLSPDYHCITVNNWKGSITCPLLDATSTKKEDKHPVMPKVFRENDDKSSRSLMPRYMPTLIIVSLFVSCGVVFVVLARKYRIQTKSNMETESTCQMVEYVPRINVTPISFFDLMEEEDFNCTEQIHNMAVYSRKTLLNPYDYLHTAYTHSNLDRLKSLSDDIRQMVVGIKYPAFDLYLSQSSQTLNSWRDNSNVFVKTSTYEKVLDCARKYNCILITGDDGNGITSIMRNVVLAFEEEEYEIYPITTPVYIKQIYSTSPLKKILFCVENICGRYDCVYYDIQLWSSWEICIKRMLESNNVKLIVSCRHRVLQDTQFQKLKLFHSCICNLSEDTYNYTENDLRKIAEMYKIKCISFSDNIYQVYKKSECFPLLCRLYNNINKKDNQDVIVKEFSTTPYSVFKSQLDKLINDRDVEKYCSLALCVMFNNHLEEAFFIGEISEDIELVFKDTCDACLVPPFKTRKDLLDALKSLKHFILKEENGVYSTFHDRLFDCLIFFLGQRIIKCMIKHAHITVIMQRFVHKEYMAKPNEYKILIPCDVLSLYMDRLLYDWSNREIISVFSNKNLIDEQFQEIFIRHISDQSDEKQKHHLANMNGIELGETPLTMSCSKGYTKVVRWLIKTDADVNESRFDGASPMLLACKEGNMDIVNELVNVGADINWKDIDGKTPLYAACQFNQNAIVKCLLDIDVDLNSFSREGISPLMISSENGNIVVVSNLLDKFADVNYCNRSGVSALFLACEEGHADVAKCLLEKGADVNLSIKDGSSSLYIACQNGHLSTVNTLLDAKIDTNKSTYSGVTPLSIACQEGYVKVVETLIKHGANVNLFRKVSPLFTACEHGHLEVVKLLLETDIDVNKCNFKTLTPLHISCLQGNEAIVVELLKTNIDINMCSAEGKSPLFIACEQNQLAIVCHLLDVKEKLDINKCTIDQRSPLFEACLRGHIEIVKVLLEKGSDINIINLAGQSALSVARENKRYSLVRLLEEKRKQ